jgi:hypothetical protein
MATTAVIMVLITLIACYCCAKERKNSFMTRIYSYNSVERLDSDNSIKIGGI